jgi:hypothetical protein
LQQSLEKISLLRLRCCRSIHRRLPFVAVLFAPGAAAHAKMVDVSTRFVCFILVGDESVLERSWSMLELFLDDQLVRAGLTVKGACRWIRIVC